jgi:hypothetical protein
MSLERCKTSEGSSIFHINCHRREQDIEVLYDPYETRLIHRLQIRINDRPTVLLYQRQLLVCD